MSHVTIRHRQDGLLELAPRFAPLDRSELQLVIVTVLLVTAGLFVSDVLPVPVIGAVAAICVVAEAFLAVKALALVLLRPVAPVHEVSRWRARRR